MRARGMTAKLDRLPICKEIKVWDLSLLSPEDQDRANDLMDLIQGSTDIEAEGLKAAIIEFENLGRRSAAWTRPEDRSAEEPRLLLALAAECLGVAELCV
jgi:hypothetical protein